VLKLCNHHQQTPVRFKVWTDTSDTQPALRSRFAGDFELFGQSCRSRGNSPEQNFRSVTATLLERGRFWRKQYGVTRVDEGGTRIRLTRKSHELLRKFVPALPRVDLGEGDFLGLGVRQCAEFVGAHGRQRRYNGDIRPLLCHFVSGARKRPAAPIKANNDGCDGTGGGSLQQTRQ
jgi:hypothetical protein